MDQERIERDGIRLNSFESFILELVLLAYPLLLISEGVSVRPHYLIIVLAIVAGTVSYLLFSTIEYTAIYGLLISFLLTVPFYLIGMPLAVCIGIFVYSSWRMQANFGLGRLINWNFLLLNTVIFTSFYFITRSYLLKAQATEFIKIHVVLFLLTTVLFIVLRYIVLYLIGKRIPDFHLWEASKVFVLIMGVGIATFLVVYLLIEYVRDAVLFIAGFLFGGLFELIAAAITPALDWVIAYLDYKRYRHYEEMEPPEMPTFVDFQMMDERIFPDSGLTFKQGYLILAVVIIAVLALVVIFRKRNKKYASEGLPAYKIQAFGRKKKKQAVSKPLYDYSAATNDVRSAYQAFEKDAQKAKYIRFVGETVKEWFVRMGWGHDEEVFETYDKARYGSLTITEEEGQRFINELQEIKRKHFTKE